MENRTAAIWARVSTRSQTELSPESQVKRVRVKLENLGYTVPPELVFKVVWTSLDLEPCPEFQKLKRLIRSKKISAVGFLDRDRLEAKGLQRLTFLSDCKENGVEPIVCQGPPFISEPEGQLVELALAIGKERSAIRAQSGAKQGLEDKAKKMGLPPTKRQVFGMKWQDGKFVPDENYNNAYLIFKLALEQWQTKRIGRELFHRGILSPRGRPTWAPSSISTILRNPVYAGRVATLKYEKVEPKHRRKETSFGKTSFRVKPEEEWHYLEGLVEQPIITWEQHLAIKDRLKLNRQYASRNARRNYLLRGLIQCQLCYTRGIERHYYGVQRTAQQPAYVCSAGWAQTYGKKCTSKPIPCSQIEQDVKAKIRNFLESPRVYLAEAKDRMSLADKTKADIKQAIRDLEKQYNDAIYQEQRALRLLSDEAFEREQSLFKARRTWLNEEIERQKVRLADLQRLAINQEAVEVMKQWLQGNLDRATGDDWRFMFEALDVRVLAFGDGTWDIEVNIPVPDATIENKTPWYTFPC